MSCSNAGTANPDRPATMPVDYAALALSQLRKIADDPAVSDAVRVTALAAIQEFALAGGPAAPVRPAERRMVLSIFWIAWASLIRRSHLTHESQDSLRLAAQALRDRSDSLTTPHHGRILTP